MAQRTDLDGGMVLGDLHLLSSVNQTLLHGRNTLLLLYAFFDFRDLHSLTISHVLLHPSLKLCRASAIPSRRGMHQSVKARVAFGRQASLAGKIE